MLAVAALVTACGTGSSSSITPPTSGSGDSSPATTAAQPDNTPSYVSLQNGFEYRPGKTSPLEQAFAEAKISASRVDRSSQAFVFDSGTTHGSLIMTVLAANGLRAGEHYTFNSWGRTFGGRPNYAIARRQYRATSADSIASMSFGPVFTNDPSIMGIDAKIDNHAWVVMAAGNKGVPAPDAINTIGLTTITMRDRAIINGHLDAVKTGKLRFAYGLNNAQTGRHSGSSGCLGVEQYCIGAHFEVNIEYAGTVTLVEGTSNAAPYIFAAMIMAWERLDPSATPATVFALADNCTIDIGAPGFDAETGRGRLDIGCMAAATAKATGSTSTSETADGFIDDIFASRIGRLQLPGATDARMPVKLSGDSLRGDYRPAPAAGGIFYQPDYAQLRFWPLPGSSWAIAHGRADEAGFSWSTTGLAAAVTYRRSQDFFGGSGSGWFDFASVRNLRLLLAGTLAEKRLRWQAWGRFAQIAEPTAAIDALHGHEIGAAVTGEVGSGAIRLQMRAHLARFAGGRISLTDGGSFPIEAGELDYGLALRIRHNF